MPATPAEAQTSEILKPTANAYTGEGANNNPGYAYDGTTGGEDTTFNRLGVGDYEITPPTIEYLTWQLPSYTHDARRLYIRRTGTGNTDDNWGLYYSINGGSDYTAIETNLVNPAKGNTTGVVIDTGLDLSNLRVQFSGIKDGGGDGGFADIYDVWLEGDYTPGDISNAPNNYAFGTLGEGSTQETGLTYFTITNNSAFTINLTIRGTDMTGGVTWTLSDTATPGTNIYGLKAGLEGADYTVVVKNSKPYNILKSNLAAGVTQRWGLKFYTPTSYTDPAAKSATITLTATQA